MAGSRVDSKNARRLNNIKLVGVLADGQAWTYDSASGNLIPVTPGGGDTIFTGGTMAAPSTIVMAGNGLTFDGGSMTINGEITQEAPTVSGRTLFLTGQLPADHSLKENYNGGWNVELTRFGVVQARIASSTNSWVGLIAGANFGVGIVPTGSYKFEVLGNALIGGDTLIEGDTTIGALAANPNARLTVEVPSATGVGAVFKDSTSDLVTIGRNGAGVGQIVVATPTGNVKFGGSGASYVNTGESFIVNGTSAGSAAFSVYSDSGAGIQYLYDRNNDLSFTFLAETNDNNFNVYNYGGGSKQHVLASDSNDSWINGVVTANFGIGTDSPTATLNIDGSVKMESLPVYADEASAVVGGLTTDSIYKTATGELRIKL